MNGPVDRLDHVAGEAAAVGVEHLEADDERSGRHAARVIPTIGAGGRDDPRHVRAVPVVVLRATKHPARPRTRTGTVVRHPPEALPGPLRSGGEVHADDNPAAQLGEVGDAGVDHRHANTLAGHALDALRPAVHPYLVGANRGVGHGHVGAHTVVARKRRHTRIGGERRQLAGQHVHHGAGVKSLADPQPVPRRHPVHLRLRAGDDDAGAVGAACLDPILKVLGETGGAPPFGRYIGGGQEQRRGQADEQGAQGERRSR